MLMGKLNRGYWVEYVSSVRVQGVVGFCVETEKLFSFKFPFSFSHVEMELEAGGGCSALDM